MAETDPIDIRFLINSDEVKKMADDVVSSVRGVTSNSGLETAKFTAQFDAMFKKIGSDLQNAFSDEKLAGLSKQLEGVNDAGQRFATTLNFIKENISDINLKPDDAAEMTQTIDQLSDALQKSGLSAEQTGQVFESSFTTNEELTRKLQAQLDALIEKETILRQSIRNAYNPEFLKIYQDSLDKVITQQEEITVQLEKMSVAKNPTPTATPASSPSGGDNAFKTNADAMKTQSTQARELQRAMQGLFGVMTSSMLLTQMLGGENKRYTETFMTLMTVYATVRGAVEAYKNVQQVSNVVTSLSNKLFATHKVAVVADTAATEGQAVATEGAAVATKGLNVALKANPIGIVITAVVALTTAVVTYINSAKSAAEKQKELNDALLKMRELMADTFDLMHAQDKSNIEDAKAAVALAQARGASQMTILALKKKELELEQNLLGNKKGENLEDIQNLDLNRKKLLQLQSQQRALANDDDKSKSDAIASQIALLKDQIKTAEDINKGIKDNTNALNENAVATDNARKEDAKRASDAAKANNELARRNAVANAEAAVAAQTEGTAEWLKAELAAIDAREKADIASARAAGETITKIQQDAYNARRAVQQKFNQQQLEDSISNINAQLSVVQKGSLEEMELRVQLAQTQSKQELNQINISAAKKAEIEAETAKKIADITKQYNDEIFESEINSQISDTNAKLAVAQKGSQDELELKKKLLDLKELMDVQSAQKSITNAGELESKITEIHANALHDREELDRNFVEKSLKDQLDTIDKIYDAKQKAVKNQTQNQTGNRVARDNQEILSTQIEIDRFTQKRIAAQKGLNEEIKKGGKNQKVYSDAIDETNKNIDALTKHLQIIKNQKLLDQFADIADTLFKIGDSLSGLGNSLESTNAGLADTLNTMGQLANAAGDVAQGIASGNPLGIAAGVVKAVGSVFSIFSAAKESARKAAEEMKKYQDDLIKNEIKYNSLLRDRVRTQDDITKETVAELEARKQMLALQNQQAQQDYNKLLAQIQASGKQIIGQHTEKYGGFLGIGRKTRVVNDTTGVMGLDYDALEKLFTEGKLDDATAKWFQELKNVHDEMINITDATADAEEQLKKVLTGTTSDSIADSIIKGFSEGKTAVEDFADSFEDLMRQAILSSIEVNTLKKPLEVFYDQFAAMAESGGKLDLNEVGALQAQYNAIIQNAANQFDQLKDITGISFGLSSQPGLSGAISRTITEDTANELSGLMRGEYDYIKRNFTTLSDSLSVQRKIEANTSNMVVTMSGSLEELKKITVNTRDTNQSVRDLGL